MSTGQAEVQRRIVSKDGHNNVRVDNVEGMVQMYLHDIWTTVVDMKWRYKLTLFTSTFVSTWFAFGVIFYLICLGHGDLAAASGGALSNHTPCVSNVETLTGAFLFSLESQTTIGYGFRCISEECPLAIFTLVAQLLLTGLAEIFVTGAFLAKLARPKKRSETVRFGYFAVVQRCRQGGLRLVVRVANMRKSLLIQCRLTGTLLRPSATAAGETTLVRQSRVDFHADSSSGGECPFLVLPLAFYHDLDDPSSPLAGLTAESLRAGDFELLVTLNATVESTAAACQSRTSYVSREVLWGYEFAPVIYGAADGRYVADFRFFDQVQLQGGGGGGAGSPNDGTEKQRLEEEYKRE